MNDDLLALSSTVRAAAIDRLFADGARAHSALAGALCAAERDDVRLQLANATARLDDKSFTLLAGVCLARGGADVVALLARQLVDRLPVLDDAAQRVVVRALLQARERCPTPLVHEAIDFALVVARGDEARRPLVERLSSLPAPVAARLLARLTLASDDDLASLADGIVDGAVQSRGVFVACARLLVRLCGLPGVRRARVLRAAEAMLADPTFSPADKLAVLDVAAAAFVWPAAIDVAALAALVDATTGAAQDRAIALLARTGTEDAAEALLRLATMANDARARLVAVAALTEWSSPLVDVALAPAAPGPPPQPETWKVTPRYADVDGTPLVVEPHRIAHPSNGRVFALDPRGLAVVLDDPAQACSCCVRPRVLDDGYRCPRTRRMWRPTDGTSPSLLAARAAADDRDPVSALSQSDSPGLGGVLARHVMFVDQGHQAGTIVASHANRVVVATYRYLTFAARRRQETASRIRIGTYVATARLHEEDFGRWAFYVATLPAPWGEPGVVAHAALAMDVALHVVIDGTRWEQTRCTSVRTWRDDDGSWDHESFGLYNLRARPPLGAGIYDPAGRLVGVMEDDRFVSGIVLPAAKIAEAAGWLGSSSSW